MFEMDEYFQRELLKEFEIYCERNQLKPNLSLFLEYLIKRNIIQNITIKRYNVIKLNDVITDSGHYDTKAKIQEAIKEHSGVNVSSIRNIINNYQLVFREGKAPPNPPDQNEERDN